MATDGVKIIDGDLAHDTYWGIMDLYDSNVDIATIKNANPFVRSDYGMEEDFYHEIFVTSYALAFWEIGELTDDILQEVQTVIKVGAGVKVWSEQADVNEGKARQKELDKLWKKINQPNAKIRARKKYRKITNFHFQANDLLAFKIHDNFYRAVVCTGVFQYRSRCEYVFVPTTYKNLKKPTLTDLLECEILGTRIGSGYDKQTTLTMQQGVDIFWKLFPEKMEFMPDPPHFFIGLVQYLIPHKEMTQFKRCFEKIGNLKIKESFNKEGSSGWATDFQRIEEVFTDLDKHVKNFKQFKFPVRLICET